MSTRTPTTTDLSRRAVLAGLTASGVAACAHTPTERATAFDISLAEWSINHRLFGSRPGEDRSQGLDGPSFVAALREAPETVLRGEATNLDFPQIAREDFGIEAVEYVNQFFLGKARDEAYLDELAQRAADQDVRNLLIMIDLEGDLGDPDAEARARAVEAHYVWAQAAARLGCHSIRVNAASAGSRDEQRVLAADGLTALCERADEAGVDVLVENHGGLSSDAAWLASVMETSAHPRLGTLPDFGNFTISRDPEVRYDPYQGVAELMPFARAVSAKSYDFDGATGDETTLDYDRLMAIVLDAGYRGYVGVEYEGSRLSEEEGVRATKALLERIRAARG